MSLQPHEKPFAILPRPALANIHNTTARLIRTAKKEIHTTLLQILTITTPLQLRPRDLISYTSPISQRALNPATSLTIH